MFSKQNTSMILSCLLLATACVQSAATSTSTAEVDEPTESGGETESEAPLDNGELAVAALDGLFNRRDLSVLDRYFGDEYLQHNPNVADGTAALRAYVQSLESQPEFGVEIHRVVAQGDLVAVHGHYRNGPDDLGRAAVDLFRVEDGRLVEHWDVLQDVPPQSVNGHSMFDGGSDPQTFAAVGPEQVEANVVLVRGAYEALFRDHDLSALEGAFAEGYVQHNPTVADGREGLRAFLEGLLAQVPELRIDVRRSFGQGDLVVIHGHLTTSAAQRGDDFAGTAVIDVFRVQDDRIVEHWDVLQEVPSTSASGRSMF